MLSFENCPRILGVAVVHLACVTLPATAQQNTPAPAPAVPQADSPPALTEPPPLPKPAVVRPPPPPLPKTQYYIGESGARVGPLSLEDLITRMKNGRLASDTLTWKSGIPEWVEACTLSELVDTCEIVKSEKRIMEVLQSGIWKYVITKTQDSELYWAFQFRSDGVVLMTKISSSRYSFPSTSRGEWSVTNANGNSFTLQLKYLFSYSSKPEDWNLIIVNEDQIQEKETGVALTRIREN